MINLGNSSKKQYIWEFMINGEPQKIELYDSKLSGKKKVIKNGMIECELICDESFFRNFSLNGHNCTIIQCGDKNELRIDNQTFEHLYNLERNKQFFSKNPEPTSSFFTSKSNKIVKNPGVNQNNFYQNQNNNNQGNQPKLFNFNIKPASESIAHENKKFSFKINEVHNVSYKENPTSSAQTNTLSIPSQTNSNLLDLDIGNSTNNNTVNPIENNTLPPTNTNNTNNDLLDVFGSSSNTNPPLNMNINNGGFNTDMNSGFNMNIQTNPMNNLNLQPQVHINPNPYSQMGQPNFVDLSSPNTMNFNSNLSVTAPNQFNAPNNINNNFQINNQFGGHNMNINQDMNKGNIQINNDLNSLFG